jgi:hypothetical protein
MVKKWGKYLSLYKENVSFPIKAIVFVAHYCALVFHASTTRFFLLCSHYPMQHYYFLAFEGP